MTDLDSLGPFFTVVGHRSADGRRWRSMRDLITGPELDERVDETQEVLARMSGAHIPRRVAASTLSLGLFARLVSPYVGATALDLDLPNPDLDSVFWQQVEGGPWPLMLEGPPAQPSIARVINDVVLPLSEVIAATFGLSARILRGNAASAVFGALTMLRAARPDMHVRAGAIGSEVLSDLLPGTGRLETRFIRNSCCLYYRIPGGGYCGDCVLGQER